MLTKFLKRMDYFRTASIRRYLERQLSGDASQVDRRKIRSDQVLILQVGTIENDRKDGDEEIFGDLIDVKMIAGVITFNVHNKMGKISLYLFEIFLAVHLGSFRP